MAPTIPVRSLGLKGFFLCRAILHYSSQSSKVCSVPICKQPKAAAHVVVDLQRWSL